MIKVSVIIPAYNAEPYIKECVSSVLNQTLKDIEIIVINDGSTDRTGLILDSFADSCCNLRIVPQENKGLYKTREIGLSLAKGEYIGWIDADDYIEPDMYERMYSEAIRCNSDLVICDYDWFPEKIPTKYKWFREYKGKVDTEFVERNSQPWNKIVKRELLEKLDIGSFFVSCHDEIYIRVLMEAKNPVTIQKPMYHYRVGTGSMSSTYTNVNHYKQFVAASEALFALMRGRGECWDQYFEYRIIYYILVTMIVAALGEDSKAYGEMKTKLISEYPDWKENMHIDSILHRNFGFLKAFAIKNVIPLHFEVAKLMCRFKSK